jgi:hypothetical protein
MRRHRNKLIGAAFVFCALAVAWTWGGNYAVRDSAVPQTPPPVSAASEASEAGGPSRDLQAQTSAKGLTGQASAAISASVEESPEEADADAEAADVRDAETPSAGNAESDAATAKDPQASAGDLPAQAPANRVIDPETGKDKFLTDPVPDGKPIPVEPQDAVVDENSFSCTLTVRCDTLLDNLKMLDAEKHELVPADGVIFPQTTVRFYEGESVFNILQREMKRAEIHMEFANTPIYNSAYIEGINNLYEFDAGELSGWMYKVNDWYPNYGCSRYQVRDGDVIELNYTCDLGRDLGEYWLGRDFFN